MIEYIFNYRMPHEISREIADRLRLRRKELKLSQQALSQKSSVSLGSLKRFEQTGEISLSSLLKLAAVMDCLEEFDQLFSKRKFQSIQEIIDEQS